MSFDLELINNDLAIRADGTIRTVTDTPKLRQDILKIVLTNIGSNKFHPWYGCSVGSQIIGQNLPDNLLYSDITSSISDSLNRLKTLQKAQMSDQTLTLAESIASIGQIDASRNPIDPRQINIIINVYTKRLTKIEEIFTVIA